jgi:DNA-binding MltR family transcriptional regulator
MLLNVITREKNMTDENNYTDSKYWNDILQKEFLKETDRAAGVLVVTLFDKALDSLLRNFFVPCPSGSDDLFDGINAPLSSFSSKINMAFRLGLISHQFCRDLHVIRKIRNDFAHDVHNCNFENTKVKSRIMELIRSCNRIHNDPDLQKTFPGAKGTRRDFLMICSWMLYCLNTVVETVNPLNARVLEFGYVPELYEKDAEKDKEI